MKHDARALVGGAAPRSAKEHVVLALLNAQWRGGSTLAEQLLFTTTIQEPFLLDEPARAKWRPPVCVACDRDQVPRAR